MEFLDLFSGAGGGSLGIKNAVKDATCRGHFEIDRDACKILHKHWPEVTNYGSVDKKNWSDFGNVDLIIAGSPCTNLSILQNAGSSGDTRQHLKGKDSRLFYEFLNALFKIKPKFFLLENVASMSKSARDEISRELGVEPVRINSGLLSAQNRDRLYWCNWDVPQPENKFISLLDIKIRDQYKYAYAWSKSTRAAKTLKCGSQVNRSYDERFRQDQLGHCLTGSAGSMESINFFSTIKLHKELPRKVFDRHDLLPYNLEPGTWRKILPLEAERMQTFPDFWTTGVSNSAAHRLMGKAMTVDVISHIINCNKELTR